MPSVVQIPTVPNIGHADLGVPARFAAVARMPILIDPAAPIRWSIVTHRIAITPDLSLGYTADSNPVLEACVTRAAMQQLRAGLPDDPTVMDALPHVKHLLPTSREYAARTGRLVHLFHRNFRHDQALSADRIRPHLEMIYILRRAVECAQGSSPDAYGIALSMKISDGETTLFVPPFVTSPAKIDDLLEQSARTGRARSLCLQAIRELATFHRVIDRWERGYPLGAISRSLACGYEKRSLGRWLKNGTTGAHSMIEYFNRRHADRVEQLTLQPLTPVAAFALGCICGGLQNRGVTGKRINFLYPRSNQPFKQGMCELFGTAIPVGEHHRRDGVVHVIEDRAVVSACRTLCDGGKAIPLRILSERALVEAFVAGMLQHKHSFARAGYVATFRQDRRKAVQFASLLSTINIVPYVHSTNGMSVVVRDTKSIRFLKALRDAPWNGARDGFGEASAKFAKHESTAPKQNELRHRIAMLGRRFRANELSGGQQEMIENSSQQKKGATLSGVYRLPLQQIAEQLGCPCVAEDSCVGAVLEAYYSEILKKAQIAILTMGKSSRLEPEDLAQEVAIRTQDILEQWKPSASSLHNYFMRRAWGVMLDTIIRSFPFSTRVAEIADEIRREGQHLGTVAEIKLRFRCRTETAQLVLYFLTAERGVDLDDIEVVAKVRESRRSERILRDVVPELEVYSRDSSAIMLLHCHDRTPTQIARQLRLPEEEIVAALSTLMSSFATENNKCSRAVLQGERASK